MSETAEIYAYQNITPQQLNALAVELPFADLMVQLRPLVNKYASWHVPGFSREDLEQEISLVLWKVQSVYALSKGSFLNIAIFSIKNRMGQLGSVSKKQVQPVMNLACVTPGCETRVPTQARAKCPKCGGRKWETVRDEHALISIQARQEQNPGFDLREPEDSTGSVDIDLMLDALQNDDLWLVEKALSGRKLGSRERDRLAQIYLG